MATFGSLFAGIGGIDLGLERAGWECRWQVEYDPFCQRVLAKHWPNVLRYGDITAIDWDGVERVDLLAGGFPCQPVSNAGRRLAQDDARWLWPEFLRAIRALRPRLVLVENVPGLLQRGMGDVLSGLAKSRYDAEWDCIPAASVGAPHLRDRVWIVAYAARVQPGRSKQWPQRERIGTGGQSLTLANATGNGWLSRWTGDTAQEPRGREPDRGGISAAMAYSERQQPRFGRGIRRPDESQFHQWLTEPDVDRVAHGVPSRVDRLRALGNAVVPQVAEVIGTQLLAAIKEPAA